MKYIIIVGNGFDLAHNLKTSYYDFAKYIVEENKKNRKFEKFLSSLYAFDNFTVSQGVGSFNTSHFPNLIFRVYLMNALHGNWGDLESIYFDLLKKTTTPKILNNQLNDIKSALSDYLTTEVIKTKPIKAYKDFANYVGDNYLILNFNYTNLCSQYWEDSSKIVNIHGQLNDSQNPIIFGYNATEREIQEQLIKNNNDYLTNIKKFLYERRENRTRLFSVLNNGIKKTVIVLGHSCSISDKGLLASIFEHDKVERIQLYYHKDFESFQNAQINIKRLTQKNIGFDKITNFEKSEIMPQYDTSNDKIRDILNTI